MVRTHIFQEALLSLAYEAPHVADSGVPSGDSLIAVGPVQVVALPGLDPQLVIALDNAAQGLAQAGLGLPDLVLDFGQVLSQGCLD